PEPSPFANVGQIFKTYPAIGVCGLLNDPFRDAMIFVRFKSAFFTGKRFQFPPNVLRAFPRTFYLASLFAQRASDLVLFLSNLLRLGDRLDRTVGVGGEIHRTEMYADEVLRWKRGSLRHVYGHEQEPFAVFPANQVTLAFCLTEPLALVLAHHE